MKTTNLICSFAILFLSIFSCKPNLTFEIAKFETGQAFTSTTINSNYPNINIYTAIDERENGPIFSNEYSLIFNEKEWEGQLNLVPIIFHCDHGNREGFNHIIFPSQVKYFQKNGFLGFVLKMEFGVSTSSLEVSPVNSDEGFPFSKTQLTAAFLNESPLDTVVFNGEGKRIITEGGWVKFSREIIGENTEDGLFLRQKKSLNESDFWKLEEVFPKGFYLIQDNSIPPLRLKYSE